MPGIECLPPHPVRHDHVVVASQLPSSSLKSYAASPRTRTPAPTMPLHDPTLSARTAARIVLAAALCAALASARSCDLAGTPARGHPPHVRMMFLMFGPTEAETPQTNPQTEEPNMPTFAHKPPGPNDQSPYRVIRTPATGAVDAIITSTDLIGTYTHFLNNRTSPCSYPDPCPACNDGHSRRWHGYVTALTTRTTEHILFECTATAAETFANYQTIHNTVRGCHFKATRPSGRPNGRVVIQARPHDQQTLRLPPPPNVHKLLCHLWNVKYDPCDLGRRTRPAGRDVTIPFPDATTTAALKPTDPNGRPSAKI